MKINYTKFFKEVKMINKMVVMLLQHLDYKLKGGFMQIFRFVIFSLGWVVLSSSAIAQSNWTEQNSGVTTRLRTVKTVSPSIGWVGGNNGTVLRTKNGGTLWTSVGGGTVGTGTIYSIAAVNDSIALVTTTPSSTTYIFRTTDAGTTWMQVYSLDGSFINGIWMLDISNGIAVGDPVGGRFVILRTTDSGLSWTRLSTEPDANANEFGLARSLCVRDNSLIWFGTHTGRVLLSTDLGMTWTASTTPLPQVSSVWFNDSLIGLITGGGIAKSIDGGKSWTLITGDFSFRSVVGDGYEKFFGLGSALGGPYGVYESPDTSFNWNNVFFYDGGGHTLSDISVGRNGSTNFGWVVSTAGTIVRYDEQITSTQEAKNIITSFTLLQNYPNPFNPVTSIKYQIPELSFVTLNIFNLLGEEITTLVNEEKPIGSYEVEFDATILPSGIYFYRLQAGSFVETKKMVLMK
jgi:photosystem II stability/assembly factor-like uncharacterized protein